MAQPDNARQTVAPEGYVWRCNACGKWSEDRYGVTGERSPGWDESCATHCELVPTTYRRLAPYPAPRDEETIPRLIREMHEQFQLEYDGPPRFLSPDERAFRLAAMREELEEYATAGPLVDQYDALLDLLVFTLGTLYRQGFPILPGYRAVMGQNMKKRVGSNGDKRGGFKQDLVKPEGWVGPEAQLRVIIQDLTDGGHYA